MECLAYVIFGACKAGVVHVKFEDGSLNTSITREKINKAIIWTNKSQKGAIALVQAQKHCKLSNFRLISPSKTRFSYILHSFKRTLMNKDAIEYIYGTMPVFVNEIKTRTRGH